MLGSDADEAGYDLRVTRMLSLFVSAENLFDENLETAVTADGVRSFGPPQVFRAGLTLRR